ncbi:protein DDI1 homolog 2 isoform X1 [Crotalus tigris]|uniref:protein DDI1 homolog 2 isoform X1 n=1 Tax=Crotalus tigris TaxID=88082 RepID=UPI00192FA4AC|nr:protein DDI1 homolog 2 isoform X1 [Crotalus tigris]
MLLTVFCLRRDRSELTFSLQVDADFELQNFRALCALESGVPASQSQIIFGEQPLTDNHRSLASYGLKDGDVVILQQVENGQALSPAPFPGLPRIDFSSIAVPGTSTQLSQSLQLPPPAPAPPDSTGAPAPPEPPSIPQGLDNPALLRAMLLANPHELSLLKERNPPLAEALLSGDLEKFTQVLVEQQQDRARREQERIRLFSADPFDLEAQAKIEEDIRQQNIEENMTIAMEEAPESFGQVVMLYINCKVNGHPVKAFVDSGAQMTIMSQACAERCNIMRLVDRRWAGIARGVGTQRIIGRVHLAQVQIEGDFLPCSFSILEEQPMDMLLGLDMLKRHQCSIDLKNNMLVIGTTGSQTSFLPEGELPECARLAYGPGREDMRPDELADQELAEALQKSADEAETSDTETTSRREAPSQPTSDGFKPPGSLPERGPKTSDSPASRSLDRSASAPAVGSPPSGRAQPESPRAGKSLDSLLAPRGWLGSEKPPASQLHLPGAGAHSPPGGSATSQNVHAASRGPAEEAAPGHEPQGMEGESSPGRASPEASEPGIPLLLEPAELPPVFKRCRTPTGERREPGPVGDASSPLAAAAEGGEVSRGGEERPEGALAQPPGDDRSLEGPPGPEASDPHHLESADLSAPDPGMELELHKRRGLPLSLGLPPASRGNVAVDRPRDQDEEPGISLASALKELHRLLVVSAKHDFRSRQEESRPLLEAPPEGPAAGEEASSSREQARQDTGLSCPTATEMLEEPHLEGGQQRVSGCGDSVPASPSAVRPLPPAEECPGIPAQHLSSGQLPSCAAAGPSSLASLGPESRSGCSPSPKEGGASSISPEVEAKQQQPLEQLSEPLSFPGASETRAPPALAANLDQIVGAGFTPQEAGEALEHAGGNADLALLILLARNIVVPT